MESREEEPVHAGRTLVRPVSPEHPDCLLTIGSQRFTARLADERDSGLYVLIQGNPLFWVEDTGVLQTSESEIAVRVCTIVRMETEEDEFASSMTGFRIGLAPLSRAELKVWPQAAPIPRRKAPHKLRWLLPLPRISISSGGVIALALIAMLLVFVAIAWQGHARQTNCVVSSSTAVAAPNARSLTPAIQQRSTEPAQSAAPAMPAIPEPTTETLQLPGVEPFLTPEVAKRLELTPSQTGAIGRLNKTTQVALQDLEKYWESAGRLEVAQRRNVVLEAARQEVLQLLTDWQRQQWEAMTR